MSSEIYKHEDERRLLIEWIKNTVFCSAKVVIAKGDEPVGNHYHQHKKEIFLLLKGKAKLVIIGDKKEENVKAPVRWIVNRGVYHLFELEKGSILLGVADKPFDPNDEIANI